MSLLKLSVKNLEFKKDTLRSSEDGEIYSATVTITSCVPGETMEYKLKNTHPNYITARPNKGMLGPGESVEVSVLSQPPNLWESEGPRVLVAASVQSDPSRVEKLKLNCVAAPTAQTTNTGASDEVEALPASPVSPASLHQEEEGRFIIDLFVDEFISGDASSKYSYAIAWKRYDESGQTSNLKIGGGGRVQFSERILIPAKTQYKSDGTVVRRVLQLSLLRQPVEERSESPVLPSVADLRNFEVFATAKLDASDQLEESHEVQVPVKSSTPGSSSGLLSISIRTFRGTEVPSQEVDRQKSGTATTSPQLKQTVASSGDDRRSVIPVSPAQKPTVIRRREVVVPQDDFPSASSGDGDGKNPLGVFESTMPKSTNIHVYVRVRPLLRHIEKGVSAWRIEEDRRSITDINDNKYEFNGIIPPEATNNEVFAIVEPHFVQCVLQGINGTLFAYGQTASGKTHTMFGDGNEIGVTQQLLSSFFERLEAEKKERAEEKYNTKVCISFFEIYNEELNDLLDLDRQNLVVRTGKDGQFQADFTSREVGSLKEAMRVLASGTHNKHMGQSVLNDRSSRSHSIFQLRMNSSFLHLGKLKHIHGQLNLVDLAGSETLSGSGSATQKKETTKINLSLSYLKKVIGELAHKEKFVSYRNSTLTKMLKNSLGGNSRTMVICCITPAEEYLKDSKSTLVFGTTAKTISTLVRANISSEGSARAELKKLREQIQSYRHAVEAYRGIEDDLVKLQEENLALNEELARLWEEKEQLQNELARSSDGRMTSVHATAPPSQAEDQGKRQPTFAPRHADPVHVERPPVPSTRMVAEEYPIPEEEEEGQGNAVVEESNAGEVAQEEASPPPSMPQQQQQQHEVVEETSEDWADAPEASTHTEEEPGASPSPVRTKKIPPRPPVSLDGPKKIQHIPDPELLKKVPKTRPTTDGSAFGPVGMEVSTLRRQVMALRIQHRRELMKKNEEIRQALEREARSAVNIPAILKKEDKVVNLFAQIRRFLIHGTPARLINPKTFEAPLCQMQFVVNTSGDVSISWCALSDTGALQADRVVEKVLIKDCKRVQMGQFTKAFGKATASLPSVGERDRMSFTILAKKEKEYNVVCEEESDFEAWMVGLNRALGNSAEWGKPLEITALPGFADLDEEEKEFCSSWHIYPEEYITAKNQLKKFSSSFITLYDVRASTGYDFYHSQRLFHFGRCRGWIGHASLYYMTPKFGDQVRGGRSGEDDDDDEVASEVSDDPDAQGDSASLFMMR